MTGRTPTKVMDRVAAAPGREDLTGQGTEATEDVELRHEARVLHSEVSQARDPIDLATSVAEEEKEQYHLAPPPRAAAASGEASVTAGAHPTGHSAHSDEEVPRTIINDLNEKEDCRGSAEEFGDPASGGSRYGLFPPPAAPMPTAESPLGGQEANHFKFNPGGGFTVGAPAPHHRDQPWRDIFPAEQIAPVESPLGGQDTGFNKDQYHKRFFTPRGTPPHLLPLRGCPLRMCMRVRGGATWRWRACRQPCRRCKPPSKVDRSGTAWGQTCIALRLCPTEPQGSRRALADTAYDILTLHPLRWVSVQLLVLEGWAV